MVKSICRFYLFIFLFVNIQVFAQNGKQWITVALKSEKAFFNTNSKDQNIQNYFKSNTKNNINDNNQHYLKKQSPSFLNQLYDKGPNNLFLNHQLENYNNIQYTGTIFLGKDQQPFEVMFDTGSDWLWIPGQNSTSIGNKRHCKDENLYQFESYRQEFSKTNSSCLLLPNPYEINYGKGHVSGNLALDLLSLDQNEIPKVGYYFLSVQEQKNLNGYNADGVFGLGFRKNRELSQIESDEENEENNEYVTDSFLQVLKEKNMIEDKMFAFYLNNNNFNNEKNPFLKKSLLTIGGYDPEYIEPGEELEWYPVVDDNYWSIGVSDLFLGDQIISENFINGVIDTGTSLIVIPKSHYLKIIEIFTQQYKKKCDEIENGHLVCSCPSGNVKSFPPITIGMLNDKGQSKPFVINPEDYIYQDRAQCEILLTYFEDNEIQDNYNDLESEQLLINEINLPSNNTSINIEIESEIIEGSEQFKTVHFLDSQKNPGMDKNNNTQQKLKKKNQYWILGDIFIRKYYSVFDLDNERIGLAVAIKQDNIIEKNNSYNMFITLGAFMFALMCGVALTVFINNKLFKKQPSPLEQSINKSLQGSSNSSSTTNNNDSNQPIQRLV